MRAKTRNRPESPHHYVVTLSPHSSHNLADILLGLSEVTIIDLSSSAALVEMSEATRNRLLSTNQDVVIEPDLSYDLA